MSFTYPGKLESWTRTGRLYGYVIYFTPAFAGLDTTSKNFDSEYPFFNFYSELMLPITEAEASTLKQQAEEMIKEIYSDALDKLEMIKKILHIYLHSIKRIYNKRINNLSSEIKVSKTLYNRFRKEVDDYMQQLASQQKSSMPTVSVIARQLLVNVNYPSYLAPAIRKK